MREAKRELAAMQRMYGTGPTPGNAAKLARAKALLRNRQEGMRTYIADANAKCRPGTEVLKRMPNREWAGDMPKVTPKPVIMSRMRHEEPLVKIKADRNALSVSPVVNTKEYHDAFEEMPVPKPVAEGAYREAGRILSATDGTEFEHLAAIDARTGKPVADNIGTAPRAARKTGFSGEEMAKIEACPHKVVLIHNHPKSIQPSYRDVMTAAESPDVAGSVVVGHDGSVWYFSVTDPAVAERLEGAYNSLKDFLADAAENAAVRMLIKSENGKAIDWRRLR